MDVSSVNSVPASQSAQSSAVQTGVAASQTEAQRADVSAKRVVQVNEKVAVEDNAARAEEKKFEAIRSASARFVSGENSFLRDIKFTIHNSQNNSAGNEYEIRFTDISSGNIDVKKDIELLGGASGNVVSGNI